MSSFHEISFPLALAFGASGGPVRQTEIVSLANGFEQRNTAQAHSRRRYDAGVGVKSLGDMQTLIAFFEARHGQLYGFRFRDPLDYQADTQIGIGDGVQTDFQLMKTYSDAAGSWERVITKPVANSLSMSVDGSPNTSFSVDTTTGMVTFNSPPPMGAIIHAVFEFDVPVRFDTAHLTTSLESFGAGSAVHVPLVEVRVHA